MSIQSIEEKGLQIASGLVPSQKIVGDDQTDTALLRKMAVDAEAFVRSFKWCSSALETFWGDGIGGIFAIFLIHILPSRPDVDPWIWIMIGDVPPPPTFHSPMRILRQKRFGATCGDEQMGRVARKGRTGTPAEGVPPVNVPSAPEWAERVNQKLYGLTLTVQHLFQG